MYVDSHSHIDGEEFDADREAVLERARAAGVRAVVVVGTGDPHGGNLERAVKLAESGQGESNDGGEALEIYATVGVHPHDARLFDAAAAERLQRLVAEHKRTIAWGEIGLDYHYDNSPRDVQRKVFARQIALAREAVLPIVIHTREADADTMAILEAECADYKRAEGCGVMHCFSSDRAMAERALNLNFMISFAGNLTFKRAEDLRETARAVPLERVLIETDCPYLAPVPFRGRRNEPAHVVEVARCLAGLHGTDVETVGRVTTENFRRFFKLSTPTAATV